MEQQELLATLEAGDFDAVIGVPETAEIDFKRSPYRLDEPAEACELAKDVTALANTLTGGLLVIGFQTRAREESGLDVVESVHTFERARFSREQCVAKVHQLAFPSVVGLDAEFKPGRGDDDRGVAVRRAGDGTRQCGIPMALTLRLPSRVAVGRMPQSASQAPS